MTGREGETEPGAVESVGNVRTDPYAAYRRGMACLAEGDPASALSLIEAVVEAEPASRSAREALARAQFDTGRYGDARRNFATIVAADPADHYAQFGAGLAAARSGDFEAAVEHLALAAAMRPDIGHYQAALRTVRATLAARR